MLSGPNNADALFARIKSVIKNAHTIQRHPINYLHRELEYPFVAKEVMDKSGAQSVRRLAKLGQTKGQGRVLSRSLCEGKTNREIIYAKYT